MATRLWYSVTPIQRRFLLIDNGAAPFAINLVLNGLIAWFLFRNATQVPLWGQSSIAGDTIATAFLLPLITCLIVTPLARGKVRSGDVPQLVRDASRKWLPHNALLRGLAIGILYAIVLAPPTIVAFRVLGIAALKPWHFVYFKGTFAAIEAVLVTPLLALWAISDISAESRPPVRPKLVGVN
jgi:hypothetical protein